MKRSHEMPFGAQVQRDGTRFALWAPSAKSVELLVDGEPPRVMNAARDGWREGFAPGVGAGARYSYRVNGDLVIADPASRFQPEGPFAASMAIDPAGFNWTDAAWRGRPWEDAVIWEAHIGAATRGGTYKDLAEKLPQLADVGITAIELMPISDCPGDHNWGYDGVLPFAPNHAFGSPDDLKNLISRAHGLGLMMMLDVVYNHFGPSGNYLNAFASSFFNEQKATPWGAAINFDGAESRAVREFFIHNALYWLDEFHFDGLRFDAVHAIADDGDPAFLAELAQRARAQFPARRIHLILENEKNEARWLTRTETGQPRLYDAQWNDDLHHCWHRLLTQESEGYYEDFDEPARRLARALAEGFVYQGEASAHQGGKRRGESSAHLSPSAFVAFLQNHDQIGNRAFGERLSDLAPPERLSLAYAALLLSPQIPMLFMGEEWAASSPFLYFVDFAHDQALSKAVREGRRQEFSHFAGFSDPARAARIPDPTTATTFMRSKLDWEEEKTAPHHDRLRATRELLRLRRTHITPLLANGFLSSSHHLLNDDALDVAWRFAKGGLRFVANFGSESVVVPRKTDEQAIWASPQAVIEDQAIRLASWTGAFTVRRNDV